MQDNDRDWMSYMPMDLPQMGPQNMNPYHMGSQHMGMPQMAMPQMGSQHMNPYHMGPQQMGMPSTCMPSQMYPMVTMPEQQLEKMYPRVYYVVYPVVTQHCDMMDSKYGNMYIPEAKEVERMIDDIYVKVETDVTVAVREDSKESDDRQLGLGGRGLLRGLIGVLLIRDLLRRRRRPIFGFPYGYSYPYGSGYGF